MNFTLCKNIKVREIGIFIQPNLPWPQACPEGIVIDNAHSPGIGLTEIKCPCTKRNSYPCDMIKDPTL